MAFVVAAATMVMLFFVLAVAIATAQERFVNSLKASVQQVKRWGGYILLVVGIWFIVLAIWAESFATIFPV